MDRFTTGTKILVAVALIGALNWGLVGILNWNLVTAIFGGNVQTEMTTASRVIFALVGLAGVASVFTLPWLRRLAPVDTRVGTRAEVRP